MPATITVNQDQWSLLLRALRVIENGYPSDEIKIATEHAIRLDKRAEKLSRVVRGLRRLGEITVIETKTTIYKEARSND